MTFEKITENVENISLLADNPAMTSTELKAEFDKGNKTIKTKFNKLVDDLNSLDFLQGTVLYENPSGIQEGNITLNESIENYKRLVFYTPEGQWLGEQLTNGATRIVLQQLDQGQVNTMIRLARLTVVNNTTLSFFANKNVYYDGSSWARTDSVVSLGKIIGYKY